MAVFPRPSGPVVAPAAAAHLPPSARLEERRKAPDGSYYTKAEFQDYFGGLREWAAAAEWPRRRAPPEWWEAWRASLNAGPSGCPLALDGPGICKDATRLAGAACWSQGEERSAWGFAIWRIAGRATVCAMLLLICFETHAYVVLAVPHFGLRRGLPQAAARGLGYGACMAILYYYARAGFTDPGHPEPASEPTGDAAEQPVVDPTRGWCQLCSCPKPQRCHHCSTCGRCVLKMDHHCIFTNNCVGLRNQRDFVLFLVALFFGLSLPVLGLLPQVPEAVFGDLPHHSYGAEVFRRAHVVVAFAAGACAWCLITNLLLFHAYLILQNETTLENLDNWLARRRSPYDKGALANFLEVFGPEAAWIPSAVPLGPILGWLRGLLADDDGCGGYAM